MTETTEETRKRKERLTQAERSDSLIFHQGWYHDPLFCLGYFDRCEHLALSASPRALGMAHTAVRMAVVNGDPHLSNLGHGVLAHAHIARGDYFWAGRTLEGYRGQALDCCPACRSDFFRRQGDLLGEERKAAESILALNRCIEEGGRQLDDDALGRRLFLRGISYHHAGQRDRALDDAGEALRRISLDSPQGFFHDTIACIAIYIVGGDSRHDALALELLTGFQERIRDRDGWKHAHTRHLWAEAHVQARLGNLRVAMRRMERAFDRLLVEGLLRESLAVTLDYTLLKCRPSALRDDSLRAARRAIDRCLEKRPDLPEDLRRRLQQMKGVLERHPEDAFRVLGDFRRSFIAPVPSGLAERIGPP